jgi:catechol-2,3-dioxygenase
MRSKSTLIMIIVFVAGVAVGAFARGKKVDASIFNGKTKAEAGRALLDEAKSEANKKASDWMRIGRIHLEAHEWPKAKEAFDKALSLEPKDAAWLAEIGGYYNLQGDRAKAEEMFTRSLATESGELWYTINMAGSYMGVEPRGNS